LKFSGLIDRLLARERIGRLPMDMPRGENGVESEELLMEIQGGIFALKKWEMNMDEIFKSMSNLILGSGIDIGQAVVKGGFLSPR
jgi:hypothetical protein